MRMSLVKFLIACFLWEVCDGQSSASKKEEEEWTELLDWYRNLVQSEDSIQPLESDHYFTGEGGSLEEKENLYDEFYFADDEAKFFDDSTLVDSKSVWRNLVSGGKRLGETESTVPGPEDEEKAVRGASLAFVFDSTGSMGDELNQVKAGAMKILAALRDHPDVPISNYIWVPFNDPGIGPITVTTDPKLFETRMGDVIASGGGDCPEMALGAIKLALQASLLNSYIYVFTDAAAKDVHLLNDVLSLVQRKQAQVVFIITNGCLDTEDAYYWVYERIAEASSGQIYKLTTDEVKEVLKYVKVALQPHVVSLLSLNKPAPDTETPDKIKVVIDDSLRQFTVSVSGINARIDVADPKGIHVDGPPRLENVLNLTNIKVVNVNEPDPGAWSVVVKSDSNYTIRSTGLSKINFNHGFSTVETTNLYETNYRPLKGSKSFILIRTSDSDQVFNLTDIDFVDLTGRVIESHKLTKVEGNPGLYRATDFTPPNGFFYLGVTGFGQDGLLIKRITSTAISAQLPEKPIVTMKTKLVGKINQRGFISCRIESAVPVTVNWFKNQNTLGDEHNCSETCEIIYNIDKFTLETEGNYTCSAKNVAGVDGKTLRLIVTGDAPTVNVNSPVIAFPGQKVHLNCNVTSQTPPAVVWVQFTATNQHSGVLHPSSTGVKLENNTLLIDSVKPGDEGWYVCVAKNNAGESQGRVLLVIKEPVTVTVLPTALNFTKGNSARLTCSATGKPHPRIEWLKNQQTIKDPSIFVENVKENVNELVFKYLEQGHAGLYTCTAGNLEGFATANAELIYYESPKIKAKENSLMVKDGSDGILKCTASGVPQPTVEWYKDGRKLIGDDRFQINNDSLTIKSVDASDFGEYSCLAINSGGSAVDHIGFTVGSSPSFLHKPKGKEIQLKHTGTIPCSAFGVPIPEIKWKRSDGRELDVGRMVILPTGALKISRVRYEDRGWYTCTVENVFGSISHQVEVKVTGAVKPELNDSNAVFTEIEAVSGGDLTFPCGISPGNPPATIRWYKDDVELQSGQQFVITTSGELIIRNATPADGGSYLCVAENAVGKNSRRLQVSMMKRPQINGPEEEELKGKIGSEVTITCPVEGIPRPSVTWRKNQLTLPSSPNIFRTKNESLIIKNASESDSGIFECTALNGLGTASKRTTVTILVPPEFTDDVQDVPISVVEGHVVVLNCNATGKPHPNVRWYKDEVRDFPQESDESNILRFFATIDHTGMFKCVVTNEAGSKTRDFNVTILVPPSIFSGHQGAKSIKAKTGFPITLTCNVTGIPPPTVLWQRNGMYVTQNTSDVLISEEGSLTILNVTKDSAGSYTCDAENLAGITQRNYYLHVNYPPAIIDGGNATDKIILKEGEDYSLACLVEGSPKPNVFWKKNGFPIDGQQTGIVILEDNTLMLHRVNKETSGVFRCEAVNSEGSALKEYEIFIMIPQFGTSEYHPTPVEVNEGDTLTLTCPTMPNSPPPTIIQWIKDGQPLDPLLHERSDEAQMKLSLDKRTLTIIETHPSDRGNYSCIATNAAGRTDANFFVDVLMTPHFEEFNHVAHRTILTGGEVVLNCSVTGNPNPKVIWRKENTSITPDNTPGVQVTRDKKHLKIVNGRVDHTGTYVCLATNKVNTKEREFYVTVLVPPQIHGSLQQTIQAPKGDDVSLDCKSAGVPSPTFLWIKRGKTKTILNHTGDTWTIRNAKCEDSGLYSCEVKNTAGTRTKYFQVEIVESPKIENQHVVDEINGVIGENITLRCKTSGNPKPDTTWFHNGRILNRGKRNAPDGAFRKGENFSVALDLINVNEKDGGVYTLLAFNAAGVVEKKFKIRILVPPTLLPRHDNSGESLTVVRSLPVVLKCPVRGNPAPLILWLYENSGMENLHNSSGSNISGGDGHSRDVKIVGNELWIKEASENHSGVYVCLAENPGGHLKYSFNVTVIDAPKTRGPTSRFLDVRLNETFRLYCNVTSAPNTTFAWTHSFVPVRNNSNCAIAADGRTLIVNKAQMNNSGAYRCLASNLAGAAEIHYYVNVKRSPNQGNDQSPEEHNIVVWYNHPFILSCLITGEYPDDVVWHKDGHLINDQQGIKNSVVFRDIHLKFSAAKPEDAGHYKCSRGPDGSKRELKFKVDVVIPLEPTEWSEWSPCSVTCGTGEQFRRRTCRSGNKNLEKTLKFDKTGCLGSNTEMRLCFNECRKETLLNNWGEWSACSKTCGKGVRRRCKLKSNDAPQQDGHKENDSKLEYLNTDDCEEEICQGNPCPINGEWSDWSEWSSCTHSIGFGTMQRVRKCDSPPPQNGGKECSGLETEMKSCGGNRCREPGKWLNWSDWSPCSQTCGSGSHTRSRKCRPSKCGRLCKGNNVQVRACNTKNCQKIKFPSSANVRVKGKLNGNHINEQINVKIDGGNGERQLSTRMDNVRPRDSEWLPYTPFLMSPVSWNAAYEADDADNGFSLTNGTFYSESDILFSSGEGLRVKHKGEGIDNNGTFVVEIEVSGEVPWTQPRATVMIEPIEQDFIQAGPKTLYSFTQNNVTIDDRNLSYTWNNSIQYDGHRGTMHYLVEKLTMRNITSAYDPTRRNGNFTLFSTIGKTFSDNKCPPGFAHNLKYMHCEDVDECDVDEPPCGKDRICQNSFGTYSCLCREGYRMVGGECLDVDECSRSYDVCSYFCHNTPGSYICSCPYGYYLNQDRRHCIEISDTYDYLFNETESESQGSVSENDNYQEQKGIKKEVCPPGYFMKQNGCKDYNECDNFPTICDVDETCMNLPGSFQCISTPCPNGYTRTTLNNHCVKICSANAKCLRGAMVSESVIFYTATLNVSNIISLDKIGQPQCSGVKTNYKVVDPTKLFKVKTSGGRHFLQPVEKINRKTLYRVRVDASSFGPKNELLYFAELVIFLTLE